MKTPTEENFKNVFRQLEAAQGALVGMINYMLAAQRASTEKTELTNTEKYELLSFFRCPDCHEKHFLEGPRNSAFVNIKCNDCGSKFSIWPPYYATRI